MVLFIGHGALKGGVNLSASANMFARTTATEDHKTKLILLCKSYLIAQFTNFYQSLTCTHKFFYCMRILSLLIATVIALKPLSSDCMHLFRLNALKMSLKPNVQYSGPEVSFSIILYAHGYSLFLLPYALLQTLLP